MADPDDLTVRDNEDRDRYEALVDGGVAGFARYERQGDVITFVHTEVDDSYEGQGVGSRLVQGALDDVRSRGEKVVARCPFVKGWIERHTAYNDLLASAS